MSLLSRLKPQEWAYNALRSARMIEGMAPEDQALMRIKELAPKVYEFMRFGSSTQESPMAVFHELRRGMDPDALLQELQRRSQRAHLNSFIKDGYEPPI